MGTSYKQFREEMLKDPDVKREYDALEPEYAIIRAMLDARKSQGLTQQELAERTGIRQGDISKLEHGNGNPSLRTLQRLAAGMGMQMHLTFTPISQPEAR